MGLRFFDLKIKWSCLFAINQWSWSIKVLRYLNNLKIILSLLHTYSSFIYITKAWWYIATFTLIYLPICIRDDWRCNYQDYAFGNLNIKRILGFMPYRHNILYAHIYILWHYNLKAIGSITKFTIFLLNSQSESKLWNK